MNSGFLSPKKIRVLHGERYLSAEPGIEQSQVLCAANARRKTPNPKTERASVVHMISEEVLLDVCHPEEDHSEEVHTDANARKHVVLGDVAVGLTALLSQEAHEADGVEAAQESPVT